MRESITTTYQIPVWEAGVLGDWRMTAVAEVHQGKPQVAVLFWDPKREPNYVGKTYPVRSYTLDLNHQQSTVRRGLFGSRGTVRLKLNPETNALSVTRRK